MAIDSDSLRSRVMAGPVGSNYDKRYSVIRILLITFLYLVPIGCQSIHNETSFNVNKLVQDMNSLHEYADKISPPPRGLKKVVPIKQFNQFDVNQYFSVLTHIRPPADQVLDYVLSNNYGPPLLYLRNRTDPAFRDYDEYLFKVGSKNELRYREEAIPTLLELDGTKESFMELIIFRGFAGKFHLPTNYYYLPPRGYVTTENEIEEIIAKNESWVGNRMTEEQITAARQISPSPVVAFNDKDSATVALISFSCTGFVRNCYRISKTRPHKITDCSEWLVKYDCGIRR